MSGWDVMQDFFRKALAQLDRPRGQRQWVASFWSSQSRFGCDLLGYWRSKISALPVLHKKSCCGSFPTGPMGGRVNGDVA
jgi:hypothetical protein